MVAALVLASVSTASATSHYEMNYRDTIRPNGQPRSQAVYDAALDACYSQTGLSRDDADTPAFKACMTTQGYRWLSTKLVQDPPAGRQDGTFIDPDTGLSCRNTGFASVCVPPQGTVRYINDEGLNCTRTGLVAICSNL
jgi:hypothetical protein